MHDYRDVNTEEEEIRTSQSKVQQRHSASWHTSSMERKDKSVFKSKAREIGEMDCPCHTMGQVHIL